jgi:hypothetical protein
MYQNCVCFEIFTTFMLKCVLNWIASVVWCSEFLATDPEVRVRSPALPDFLRSSGSGTMSAQPREYNCGATWKKNVAAPV